MVAGVVVPLLILQLEQVWKLDDPTGAFAVHGIGGLWSLIATGIFGGLPTHVSRGQFFLTQLLGGLAAIGLAGGVMFLVMFLVKRFINVRVREEDEFDGLDLAEHDVGSYPDFQQTTIKSYHLREA